MRQNVFLIVRNRKVLEVHVGDAGRRGACLLSLLAQIVEGVERHREVRRPDRLAKKAQRDSVLAREERLEGSVSLRRSQLFCEEPRRRIGQRRAKAVNLLEVLAIIHGDQRRGYGWIRLGEMKCLALRQSFEQIRCRLVDRDGLGTGGRN